VWHNVLQVLCHQVITCAQRKRNYRGLYISSHAPAQAYQRRTSASLRQKSAFLLKDRIWIITQQIYVTTSPLLVYVKRENRHQMVKTIDNRRSNAELPIRQGDGKTVNKHADEIPRLLNTKTRPKPQMMTTRTNAECLTKLSNRQSSKG
jgi:uncharacterized protein YbaR (Trm112 family)